MSNNPAISVETRKLVQKFAKEQKYKPNVLAMQLRTKRNTTIGVIVPQIVHYFFSTVLAGIQEEAEKENYNLLICQSSEDYVKEIKSVETLLDARVSGILASQSKTTKEYGHFQDIIDNNVDLVFFDRICTGINTDKVVVDDYEGAFKAVDYMVSTGCKKIAFLGSDVDMPISNNRRMGYESALRKNKIEIDKSFIKECDTHSIAQTMVPDMLTAENVPDAFFCINDEVAAYCLQLVKAAGFRVPEDISICGFTNGYLTEVTDPTLTSVDQHGFKIGVQAARLLIDRIEGRETKKGVVNKLIKTELVVRNSTR